MFKVPYNLPRKVPWISWKQWNYVRNWLFSSNLELQERGIQRVNAWRSREKLPLAIEATASLVELNLACLYVFFAERERDRCFPFLILVFVCLRFTGKEGVPNWKRD
jgi:hypothetical protein